MSRILFITSAHPGGRGRIGAGEGVSAGNLHTLLNAGNQVHVVCMAFPDQTASPDVVSACASYTTLPHSTLHTIRAILGNISRGAWIAPWFFARANSQNLNAIRRLIIQHSISSIWIEFPSSLGLAEQLGQVEVAYFVHDVLTQKVGRRPLLKFAQEGVARVESRLLSHVKRCHVMSDKDAVLLRQLQFRGEVVELAPGNVEVGVVDNARPVTQILEAFAGAKNLVFFGNMQRAENHYSMILFLMRTFPIIRRACPAVQLWILGLQPRWTLRMLASLFHGVHVTGAVDDPGPAFARADLCVAPVLFGAGVKIKVLQMLDAGAKVVATPTGAEGIPASSRLIVADPHHFAQAVIAELSDR